MSSERTEIPFHAKIKQKHKEGAIIQPPEQYEEQFGMTQLIYTDITTWRAYLVKALRGHTCIGNTHELSNDHRWVIRGRDDGAAWYFIKHVSATQPQLYLRWERTCLALCTSQQMVLPWLCYCNQLCWNGDCHGDSEPYKKHSSQCSLVFYRNTQLEGLIQCVYN